MAEILLTPSATARMLKKSEQTIRLYALKGKLPFVKTTTGRRLFRERDVLKFMEKTNDEKFSPEAA